MTRASLQDQVSQITFALRNFLTQTGKKEKKKKMSTFWARQFHVSRNAAARSPNFMCFFRVICSTLKTFSCTRHGIVDPVKYISYANMKNYGFITPGVCFRVLAALKTRNASMLGCFWYKLQRKASQESGRAIFFAFYLKRNWVVTHYEANCESWRRRRRRIWQKKTSQ